ncbi:hypothetical protein IH992_18520, partial [Candidatus Poribacteria bacterium]|nr:hypothetical protein [Candidatus Poribacteria bacterium]
LPDRDAVVNWIINNQLGRRNLTAEQASYLRGKQFNREKSSIGAPVGNRNAAKQLGQDDTIDSADQNDRQSTAQRLAEEHGVSERTIKRDGKYAQAVDKISSTFGEPVKQGILNREVLATKQDVQTLGKLADEVSATDDRPPLLRKAEKMQDLLDELPDDVQEYILDNNENEFTLLQEAVRKGHKREKLRSEIEVYPRSDREIEFEKHAAEVWESIDDKGLPPLEKFKFRGMRDEALRVLTTPLRIPDLYAKRKWLKKNDESERMAWIAESREQGEYYVGWVQRTKQEWKQAKKDVKDGTFFLDDADIGESSTMIQKEDDYALILTHAVESLPLRLQRKVFNDALKRYHSDKLSDVDDEQERQDCAEILLSLLGAKDLWEVAS